MNPPTATYLYFIFAAMENKNKRRSFSYSHKNMHKAVYAVKNGKSMNKSLKKMLCGTLQRNVGPAYKLLVTEDNIFVGCILVMAKKAFQYIANNQILNILWKMIRNARYFNHGTLLRQTRNVHP